MNQQELSDRIQAELFDRIQAIVLEPIQAEEFNDRLLLVKASIITSGAIDNLSREFDHYFFDGNLNGLVIGDN